MPPYELKIRLLELMLYRECGGVGYDPAINALANQVPEYYKELMARVNSIKEENNGQV